MNRVSFFQSIGLKIIIILTLFLLLAIQVIGTYFNQQLETSLIESYKDNVNDRVQVLVASLEEVFKKEREEDGPTIEDDVRDIISRYSSDIFSDLQVVDPQFRVVGEKNEQDLVGKKISKSDINIALRHGQEKEDIRINKFTSHRVFVKTVPIKDGDVTIGVVSVEAPIEEVYNQLEDINQIFLNGTVLAIIVSVILGILIARTITKPIMEMRRQALVMARGDFSKKVNVYGTDEIGQLAMAFNDMNDRLKAANQLTEEERQKLSTVLTNMSDGVIATDEKGLINLINGPASDLIGLSHNEARGKSIVEVLQLEDKLIDIQELEDTGSLTIDFSDEDELFLIKANFSVVQDENENFMGLITVISDVTEQEKVERERREFVSNVSHELRTPLTTMRSYLEALSDGAWEDKDIAPRFLQVTQQETERMIRLVNDLLQLSKMDQKETIINLERVNFGVFIHHILDRFDMNKTNSIGIERRIPKQDFYVWLDKDKIIQVVDNIMTNAIKYSPEGGKIIVTVAKEAHRVRVSISDQGLGIARDKVDKIFDRFYRVDKARARNLGGTGLGLAISKEIIHSHHGRIWASSKEGQGTTIFFTLPLKVRKRGSGQ